ncbi:MAG TPA: hypothetical protein VLB44_03035, partial [Kofleriaceae bacterium]|nr:hypothetical protein [Kofleriaceae bacterium]
EKQKGINSGGHDPEQGTRSTAERNKLLTENRGLTTAQAHATQTLPEDYAGQLAILRDPKNWTPERQAFHEEVLKRAVEQAMKFAEEMRLAGNDDPTIYAMRGNTASGKTRSVAQGGAPELSQAIEMTKAGNRSGPASGEEPLRHRANNPDAFKLEIYAHDSTLGLSSNQAHIESSILSMWFHERMLAAKDANGNPVDMLIDKRLSSAGDTQKLLADAKRTGRKVSLLDVDADLATSLAGVLDRKHGGTDPIPPFHVIKDGFEGVRGNRLDTIFAIAQEPTAAYRLMGTDADGNKTLVAEIKPIAPGEPIPADPLSRLIIHDEARFNRMIPSPAEAKTQAKALGETVITQEGIDQMTKDLPEGYRNKLKPKLEANIGKTWKQAVDEWSTLDPTTAPGSGKTGP